ncbi:MAG TPA: hypothetical protein VJZ00_19105 [Thermoanaerobaculia bacterium]|nr:hypothetical protein [Thermoanaerobaculia bacterium]
MSSATPQGTGSSSSSWSPSPPDAPIRMWQIWVIGAIAIFFLFSPFLLGYAADVFSLRMGGLGWNRFFYVLAILPGAIGVLHHVVSTPQRRMKVQQLTKRYFEIKASTGTGDGGVTEDNTSSVVNACAASLMLTGVFLVVAVVSDARLPEPKFPPPPAAVAKTTPAKPPATTAKVTAATKPATPAPSPRTDPSFGIIFAGLGAYVAVLYYMAGRLYANALSSRFLATSALRSASAIALGYVLARAGIEGILPSTNTTMAAYFVVGLFHNWAMNAMRAKALTLLGAPKSDNEELPITIIEGVEDTSADLLSEYGVSTVQHLALIDAGELSDRTLIPLDRVLDWTDQALLIQRIKRAVASTRTLGVRTATDFARQYLNKAAGDQPAKDLLASIAEKSGLGAPAVEMLGREFANDARVKLIHKTLQGTDLAAIPDPVKQFDAVIDNSLKRYDIVGLNDTTPAARFVIRPPAQ